VAPSSSAPLPGGPSAGILRDRRLQLLLICGGVMALVVVTVVGFSGALFSSSSSSPGNQFEAGTVSLELAKAGQIVDGTGLEPGVARTGSQTVTNLGHRARVVLGTLELDTSSALVGVLLVVVRQTDPSLSDPIYSGPLSELDGTALGTFAHDESRSFSVEVRWPAEQSSPALEGASTSFRFDWRAESLP
jgi:hypothetical protein